MGDQPEPLRESNVRRLNTCQIVCLSDETIEEEFEMDFEKVALAAAVAFFLHSVTPVNAERDVKNDKIALVQR